MKKTETIHITVTFEEAIAIARLSRMEIRDMRAESAYLIRQKLIELGLITISPTGHPELTIPEETEAPF